eukprot:gene17818-24199_t
MDSSSTQIFNKIRGSSTDSKIAAVPNTMNRDTHVQPGQPHVTKLQLQLQHKASFPTSEVCKERLREAGRRKLEEFRCKKYLNSTKLPSSTYPTTQLHIPSSPATSTHLPSKAVQVEAVIGTSPASPSGAPCPLRGALNSSAELASTPGSIHTRRLVTAGSGALGDELSSHPLRQESSQGQGSATDSATDSATVQLLLAQVEALMKDRARLQSENNELQRENTQLHELVGYLSAEPEEGFSDARF